tara:strand:+ start:1743 stop:2087 length:345 start_codon:yes stop_codon:yes gene_type:complete
MSCLEKYLQEFFKNPTNIEEYKVNFLKNYYFSKVNCYFNIEFKDFQLGTTNNKNLIHFASKIDNKKLIYKINEDKYYENTNNNLFEIDLNDYNSKLFTENKRISCLNNKVCIIL